MQCTDVGLASREVPINFKHTKTQFLPIMFYNCCQNSKLKIVNTNNVVIEKK